MGKVLKPLLLVAAVAVNVIPGAGQAISAGIFAATGATISAAAALAATTAAIGIAGSAIKTGGKSSGAASVSSFDPKSINIDPAAKRKMVFGRTAFPLDLRYGEPSGTSQEYIDYVFALAAHRSDGIEEIWIEDKQAWTSAGGAQGIYAGYLTVEVILEGGAGAYHTVNAGAGWGASQRMTGCTTMKVRVKRSNNSTSSTSPFANGIAGRWTVIGRGMPLYDPALDSTVAGGSGTQRANDCTTWRYTAGSVERGRNHALQLLAYLLGYRINGVVSAGLGMSPTLIDLASFATAAARCDEAVTLAVGGSHRRYEGGAAFSDDQEPEVVFNTLLAAMNAELIDDGGRLGLRVAVNDLTAAITLTDDDIQGGFSWNPAPAPDQQFTVVRGRFQQPNAPSLFGMADYPDVVVPRTSPAPRPLTLELGAVQDVRRAERIAKQVGQRSLYQGMFSCRIGVRGWYLRRNMIVAVTSQARAWSGKLFRVRSLRFNIDATVDIVLREENAAVYQWDNAETGNVSPVTPTTYDPRNAPWITAVATAATTAVWNNITGDGKPTTYRIRTCGYNTQLTGNMPGGITHMGLWNEDTQTNIAGLASMYSVCDYDAAAGTWRVVTFETLGNPIMAYPLGGFNFARSCLQDWLTYLNTTFNARPIIIFTFDEPQTGRLDGDISNQIYTMGGSRSVFGSPRFEYRNAYVLIGSTNAGEGNGAEYLAGAGINNPPKAYIDVTFQMVGGVIQIAGKTPSLAQDITFADGITIEGLKPATPGATRNIVTYSASAPASPAEGDLWVDTSGFYAVFKLRSGGAWVTGANALSAYNALSGRPVALADINTTESAKLSGIEAGATLNLDSQNLIKDPLNLSLWWGADANVTRFAESYEAAPFALRIQGDSYGGFSPPTAAGLIPVNGAFNSQQQLWFNWRARSDGDMASSGTMGVRINVYDGRGDYLNTFVIPASDFSRAAYPGNGWYDLQAAVTVPYRVPHYSTGIDTPIAFVWPHWAVSGYSSGFGHMIVRPWVGYSQRNSTYGANRRNMGQFFGGGAQQIYSTPPLGASNSGGVGTITIYDHSVIDDLGTISYVGGSVSGLTPSVTYAVTDDDPYYQGGSRTYSARTGGADLAAPGRRLVGYVTIPASDGGSGGGYGGGAGGGGYPGGGGGLPLP